MSEPRQTNRTLKEVTQGQDRLKEIITRKIIHQRKVNLEKGYLSFSSVHSIISDTLFSKGKPNHIRISIQQTQDGYYEIAIENILSHSKHYISLKKTARPSELINKLKRIEESI